MSWLLPYAIFLDPQTLALYMEVTNNSWNQWVRVQKLVMSRSDCLNGYIPNRIIPHYGRVGSTNTDRQSNSKWYSEWVDYHLWLTPHFISNKVDSSYDHRSQSSPSCTFQLLWLSKNHGAQAFSTWHFWKWCAMRYKFGHTLMMLLLLYVGLLMVEGDEHKRQVRFLFQDLFANCCLILQVAQDFGQLCWATGVLNI